MGKDWGPSATDAGCTGKSSHSVAPKPYDWPPAGRPHAAYMRASGALSSACEQRWWLS